MEDGRLINEPLYQEFKREEIEKIKAYVGIDQYRNGKFNLAIELFDKLVLEEDFKEFLTINAYQLID